MVSLREIVSSLRGCFRLAILDENAHQHFNLSPGGVKSSFFAFPLVLLISAYRHYIDLASGQEILDPTSSSVIAAIVIACSWILYLLAVRYFAELLDLKEHFPSFVIVYNWFQLFFSFIWLTLTLLLMPHPTASEYIGIVVLLYGFFIQWFILNKVLGASFGAAIALMAMEVVIYFLILFTGVALFQAG